eukprot:m.190380 g.190380  ORF g.190380 m.190380 type:complete len:127 (-) comp53628_c0_seq30:38-418(-)
MPSPGTVRRDSSFHAQPARTIHDEYWHWHTDQETYEGFSYTCLVYLSNFKTNFTGGQFAFRDVDGTEETLSLVEPKTGRLSCFTSGAENNHRVQPIINGMRFALTLGFTCLSEFAIADPSLSEQLS